MVRSGQLVRNRFLSYMLSWIQRRILKKEHLSSPINTRLYAAGVLLCATKYCFMTHGGSAGGLIAFTIGLQGRVRELCPN
jgi:hypothetical protein